MEFANQVVREMAIVRIVSGYKWGWNVETLNVFEDNNLLLIGCEKAANRLKEYQIDVDITGQCIFCC